MMEFKSIPTSELVKSLPIVTAGLAKQVDDVKRIADKIYEATRIGILEGENFSP